MQKPKAIPVRKDKTLWWENNVEEFENKFGFENFLGYGSWENQVINIFPLLAKMLP